MAYNSSMKRISLFITAAQLAGLHALVQSSGLKMAEHIRRAIDAYLKKKS